MIEHPCTQGEGDWLKLRLGRVTASEADALLTPELKPRTGAGVQTYLFQKIAEAWRGTPLPGFTSFATEQGEILEDEARNWFALTTEHAVRNVGFLEHDDGRCGCSPDALLDDDGGLELKCPQDTNHVRYLLDGRLPKDYAAQVHFSLYVSGRKWWKFVSYRRQYPAFTFTVERDEEICERIAEALASFYENFDEAWSALNEQAAKPKPNPFTRRVAEIS